MSQEPDALAADSRSDGEVMASIDEGEADVFVIADVTRDGAYLSTPLSEAATLSAWR
ncbi:DUF7556 family protein [Halorhabdus rudnickae]|uniref:DUF7556 family protein n=1 Tax=Halorhabdus rudnickae TaxID=1775544 RepID=UPI00143827D1|nr:hypothetical protein [Halorhabdus rudnickae]